MSQADDIRLHVYEHHIKPAIESGLKEIVVLVKCVHREMGGQLDRTAIMVALTAKTRLGDIGVELDERLGSGQGWRGVRYRLLESRSDTPESVPSVLSPPTENEPQDDLNESLRDYMLQLSPSQFQELVREYMEAKGFDDAEMEIIIRMKT